MLPAIHEGGRGLCKPFGGDMIDFKGA